MYALHEINVVHIVGDTQLRWELVKQRQLMSPTEPVTGDHKVEANWPVHTVAYLELAARDHP